VATPAPPWKIHSMGGTAEHHVSDILAELGFTTRAEAAAHAVKQSRRRRG